MFGKSNYFFIFLFFLFLISSLNSEDNISVSPLINVDEIKPSYEEISPQSNDSKNEIKPNFLKEPKSFKKNEEFSAVKVTKEPIQSARSWYSGINCGTI